MFKLPFNLLDGWNLYTVDQLVREEVIEKPLDGNHGEIHPKSSDYVERGIPFVMASDLEGGRVNFNSCKFITAEQASQLRKGISKVGDVLISHKATIGRTAIVQESEHDFIMLTPQVTYYRVKDNSRLNNIYLKAYFDSRFFQTILGLWAGSGSTRAYLGITDQLKLPIIVPPIDSQISIANHVGKINDKIELNRQINQTLEQMAQAIFKSWFVDFHPVRAKMEGRDTGLPTHIADLFPDELEESELGLKPKGWVVSTIGDEVEVVGGGTPSTQKAEFWDDGEYYWTTPKDLSGLPDKVLLSTERKITQKGLENISSGLLPINTVLMSSRAPVGYLVLAKIPTAINQGFIAMKCNKQLSPEYVLQWANSKMDDIKQRASGSTFAEISKKTFRPMGLVIPTKDILAEFTKVAECIYNQIAELVAQSNNLATTRDLLLPKLLSGAIEVKV